MPLNTLSAGHTHTLVEDVVYALPPVQVMVHSTVLLQTAITNSDAAFADVTATTTGVNLAACFVRCTTAAASVSVKRV
jgi:hypothetical protein